MDRRIDNGIPFKSAPLNTEVRDGCRDKMFEELFEYNSNLGVYDSNFVLKREPEEDKETIARLRSGILHHLEIDRRGWSSFITIWRVRGYHSNASHLMIDLLVAQYQTVPCFFRLGRLQGLEWVSPVIENTTQ